MRGQRFTLLLGVFTVMALSNAIVPVLPEFAEGTALQGAVYAAYFFGALVTVLPAGILSDRYGRTLFLRTGLAVTTLSGILIVTLSNPIAVLGARLAEGIGAGLFVPAAMSWMNSQPDHERLSGWFMGSLNLGLLVGVYGTGWFSMILEGAAGGLFLFTALSLVPLLFSLTVQEGPVIQTGVMRLLEEGSRYVWLYISALILLGATGVVSALYPQFTGATPAVLSVEIGTMYLATIITVVIASHAPLQPVPTIRVVAILMAFGVVLCYFSPIGFALVGGLAGIAISAQLAFLAETGMPQGAVMGLFNVSTYSGMSLLPFVAGLIVQFSGENFLIAFLVTAVLCCLVAYTIGKCTCRRNVGNQNAIRE